MDLVRGKSLDSTRILIYTLFCFIVWKTSKFSVEFECRFQNFSISITKVVNLLSSLLIEIDAFLSLQSKIDFNVKSVYFSNPSFLPSCFNLQSNRRKLFPFAFTFAVASFTLMSVPYLFTFASSKGSLLTASK